MAKKYRGKLRAVYGGSSAAGRDNIPLSALKGMTPKQHCEKLIAEASKNSNLKGYFKEESVGEDVCMLPHANYFGGGYLAPVYSYYYDVCEEIELTIKINDKIVSSMQTHRLKGGERVIITANQNVTWQANSADLEKIVLNAHTYSFTAPKKVSNFFIKATGKCDPKANKYAQFMISPCQKIALDIKVNNAAISAAQPHKLKGGDKVIITANQKVNWNANPTRINSSSNATMYSFTAPSQPTNITIKATSECDSSASEITQFVITKPTITLSEQDVIDIIKVTSTEVVTYIPEADFKKQTAGVIDTILNRVYFYNGNVRGVLNARNQFCKISGEENAYGSVQNMPEKDIKPKAREQTIKHLQDRMNGMKSSIGGHYNYFNPNKSKPNWGPAVKASAEREGLVFGHGVHIHYHGTAQGERKAPELSIVLPEKYRRK